MSLKQMVAQVASTAAGCRYCQAHTAATANNLGISEEKLADLWLWQTSDHFDAAERAALDLAFHAASVPNTTTDAHFDALREHYNEEQIVALVATISMFGYLNRWNDTMATSLEEHPTAFASEVLSAAGWEPGKHADGPG
jgi:AhpD family alkylhydroperoxidase